MDDSESFDIYRGMTEDGAVWVGSVAGLSKALHRAEEIAADIPGQYFLFDPRSRSILMKLDSGVPPRPGKRKVKCDAPKQTNPRTRSRYVRP